MAENSIKKSKWLTYNLGQISECRDVFFGLSAIFLAVFHSRLMTIGRPELAFLDRFIKLVQDYGNLGVDIFLILSGIGLYYSFSKNSNIREFYKRRAVRVLPPLFIVTAIYYSITMKSGTVVDYIKNVTTLSFFTDGDWAFWYFSIIIILYALYPFIHKLIDRYRIFGLALLVVLSIGFYCYVFLKHRAWFDNWEIGILRTPMFFFGCWLGKLVKEGKKLPTPLVVGVSGALIAGVCVFNHYFAALIEEHYFIERVVFWPLAIGMVFLCSAILPLIPIPRIKKILSFFGFYSFEIYLLFNRLPKEIAQKIFYVDKGLVCYYFAMFVATVFVAILLKSACDSITKFLLAQKKK